MTMTELKTLEKYHLSLQQSHQLLETWLSSDKFVEARNATSEQDWPCMNFDKLMGFQDFKLDGRAKINSAELTADIVHDYTKLCSNQKKLFREFRAQSIKKVSQLKTAIKTYVTAHKNAAKQVAKKPRGEKAASKLSARAVSMEPLVWSSRLQVPECKTFPSENTFDQAELFDLTTPYVVVGVDSIIKHRREDGDLKACVDFFETSVGQTMHSKRFGTCLCFPPLQQGGGS